MVLAYSGGLADAARPNAALAWERAYAGEGLQHVLTARRRDELDGDTSAWYDVAVRPLPCTSLAPASTCARAAVVVARLRTLEVLDEREFASCDPLKAMCALGGALALVAASYQTLRVLIGSALGDSIAQGEKTRLVGGGPKPIFRDPFTAAEVVA
jgi:hypothetical protein